MTESSVESMLMDAGECFLLVVDVTSPRRPLDREIAIWRMDGTGIALVTAEMILFEWLERGNNAEFRDIPPSIRDSTPGTDNREGRRT